MLRILYLKGMNDRNFDDCEWKMEFKKNYTCFFG